MQIKDMAGENGVVQMGKVESDSRNRANRYPVDHKKLKGICPSSHPNARNKLRPLLEE